MDASLLYLDLDGFKEVNDRCGHATGDEVLKVVANRLQTLVRADDIVARFGGDEFAIVCKGCGRDEATKLSDRILKSLREPMVIDGRTVKISASIGVATSVRFDQEALRRADAAMYRAKQAGRDTVHVA
jgi:diguanylate cyclase (GGDEF)-like protein